MVIACVTAPFQLVLPSGSEPVPGPSVMCMMMLPFAHFEPSVAKPRVVSVERATSARTMMMPRAKRWLRVIALSP